MAVNEAVLSPRRGFVAKRAFWEEPKSETRGSF